MSRRVLVAGALALAAVAVACGSDGDRTTAEPKLPPNDRDAIAAEFDPALADLGLRVTRAALVDIRHGYRESATGDHLALYVEPTGEYTNADYVDGIVASARVFLPAVFDRWPGLRSFDVCQEPRPSENDEREPPPVTQIYLTRDEAGKVDWDKLDLAGLLAALRPARDSFTFYVAPEIAFDPAYAAAARGG